MTIFDILTALRPRSAVPAFLPLWKCFYPIHTILLTVLFTLELVKITLYVLIYFPYTERRVYNIIVAGWLSVCLFHCSNFGTNFWDVMKFLCTSCHQKAIYFYVFILYHIGAITERVSMHEDIHSLQAVRHQTLLK